jgi:hypothetical protein
MKVKAIQTSIIGFGLGYDYKDRDISVHLFTWCLEIKFKNKTSNAGNRE